MSPDPPWSPTRKLRWLTACWTSTESRLVFTYWGLDDLDDLFQAKREFDGGALWPEQANQERIRDTRGQEKKPCLPA